MEGGQEEGNLMQELQAAEAEFEASRKLVEESAKVAAIVRANMELSDEDILQVAHKPPLKGILRREDFPSEVLRKWGDTNNNENNINNNNNNKEKRIRFKEEEGEPGEKEFIESAVQYLKEFKEEETKMEEQKARIQMLTKKVKFSGMEEEEEEEEEEEKERKVKREDEDEEDEGREQGNSDDEREGEKESASEESDEDEGGERAMAASGDSDERIGQKVRRGTKDSSGEFRDEKRHKTVKPAPTINRLGQKVRRGTKDLSGGFKSSSGGD